MDPDAGALYLDPDGSVLWADTNAAEILRYSVEELVGRSLDELLQGDLNAIARLQALLEAGSVDSSCTLRIWRPTGGWGRVLARVTGETHPAFGGTRVLITDVTRSERRTDALALMVDAMWEAMFVVDDAGEILAANPAAARTLGLSPEFFTGKVHDEIASRFTAPTGEPLAWIVNPVGLAFDTRVPDRREVVQYRHPDGTDRRFVARVRLHGRDGEPRATVMLADVDDVLALASLLAPSDE